MRLYVPATRNDLDTVTTTTARATWPIGPRVAHAVTPALRAELPDEDDEGLEYAAWLAAADDSLGLVLQGASSPLRVVVTVEVPDGVVGTAVESGDDVSSSTVQVTDDVDAQVVCAHVDETDAGPDVLRVGQVAEADLDDALQAVVDRDLLWYDWTELDQAPR
ncbi:hypothetical protein GCM10023221_08110 [Luteimicrobium xylanilyticum]|uniref:Uncharacterized protein n=1 Tax=Luteimicrobium xylanilyticum TaxID=1133546 RepID=A0A5P9QD58_9MICO|nr:hypothetical protein [Luteimicrobium xylanilyticum]QFU99022.1 hypothetical protein KDY119_02548 [Luteimicrobium xylanilyticum]